MSYLSTCVCKSLVECVCDMWCTCTSEWVLNMKYDLLNFYEQFVWYFSTGVYISFCNSLMGLYLCVYSVCMFPLCVMYWGSVYKVMLYCSLYTK